MRRVPREMLWLILTLLVLWLVLTHLADDPPQSTPLSHVVLVSTLISLGILIGARRERTGRRPARFADGTRQDADMLAVRDAS